MVGIRSGSTKSCACLSVLSVLLLLGSFCPVLVGLPSSIHLTTYNIAELGNRTGRLWTFTFLGTKSGEVHIAASLLRYSGRAC